MLSSCHYFYCFSRHVALLTDMHIPKTAFCLLYQSVHVCLLAHAARPDVPYKSIWCPSLCTVQLTADMLQGNAQPSLCCVYLRPSAGQTSRPSQLSEGIAPGPGHNLSPDTAGIEQSHSAATAVLLLLQMGSQRPKTMQVQSSAGSPISLLCAYNWQKVTLMSHLMLFIK